MSRVSDIRPSHVQQQSLRAEVTRQANHSAGGKPSGATAPTRGSMPSGDGLENLPQRPLVSAAPATTAVNNSDRATAPFAALLSQAAAHATTPGAAAHRALGTPVALDVDITLPESAMGKLLSLESRAGTLTTSGQTTGAPLANATATVREGVMLSLADAGSALTSGNNNVGRDVVEHLGQVLIRAEKGTGDKLQNIRMSNVKSAMMGLQGHFSPHMNIQAFVQAVLRESYLLQNEELKDFADKVKFYNELKKKMRAQLQGARNARTQLNDGDTLPEGFAFWTVDDDEPWSWEAAASSSSQTDNSASGSDAPEENADVGSEGGFSTEVTPIPDNFGFTYHTPGGVEEAARSLLADFEGTYRLPHVVERGMATAMGLNASHNLKYTTRFIALHETLASYPEGSSQWQEYLSDIATSVPNLSDSELNSLLSTLIEYVAQDNPPPAQAKELLRTVADAATCTQLRDYQEQKIADTGTAWKWETLNEIFDGRYEQRQEQVEAFKFGLMGAWQATPEQAAFFDLYAEWMVESGEGVAPQRSAAAGLVIEALAAMSPEQARDTLALIAANNPGDNAFDEVLFQLNPNQLFANSAVSDWAFLDEVEGSEAQEFFRAWAGITDDDEAPTEFTKPFPGGGRFTPGLKENAGALEGDEEVQADGTSSESQLAEETASQPLQFNAAEVDAYIEYIEGQLETAGEDAQLANVDLQNSLQRQQQILQMMSNISKMLHDTAMAIIRKIGS